MRIDPNNPHPNVVTRDNQPVMLFAYMSKQQRPYLGIFYNREEWIACSWNKDGSYICAEQKSGMDLVEVKDLLGFKNNGYSGDAA
jgi:hypothetical protein